MNSNMIPWIAAAIFGLYSIHATTLERSVRRALDGAQKTVAVLSEKSDGLSEALAKASADAERVPGLTADLAGTRGYLKQVQDEKKSTYGQLMECRKQMREQSDRFERDRLIWAEIGSRPVIAMPQKPTNESKE